jgi:hypothetical protein
MLDIGLSTAEQPDQSSIFSTPTVAAAVGLDALEQIMARVLENTPKQSDTRPTELESSSNQMQKHNSKLSFMDLARELREMVYEHCLADYPTDVNIPQDLLHPYRHTVIPVMFSGPTEGSCPDESEVQTAIIRLPSIAFASKQILQEAVPVCLRTRLLKIRHNYSVDKFSKFLAQFPQNKGFAAVKKIWIMSNQYRVNPDSDSALSDFLRRASAL